jgi:hypothetical protein
MFFEKITEDNGYNEIPSVDKPINLVNELINDENADYKQLDDLIKGKSIHYRCLLTKISES